MGKKKDGVNFNPYLVLLVIVLLCTIVSYFVAPGAYDREKINGLNVVIADSYHPVPRTPVSFLEMYRSIPKGLEGAATMMFVVMIIGGVVEVYNRTGAIGAGIKSVIITALSMFWVLRYAAKIKKDPSQSLMKDIDQSGLQISIPDDVHMDGTKTLSLLIMAACFAFTIFGLLTYKWSFNEMGAIFLIGATAVGTINRMSATDMTNAMVKGAQDAFPGALIIGLARSIQVVMADGGLVDPLVHGLSSLMGTASTYSSAVGMFIVNLFINALIPSGSGQAMAVMPIMIPLADMLHITRQTAVLAFQFGDGISNTFWFTNGTLLIYCGLAKVPLKIWYKFIIPLQVVFFLLQLVFLYIAVSMNYGPF